MCFRLALNLSALASTFWVKRLLVCMLMIVSCFRFWTLGGWKRHLLARSCGCIWLAPGVLSTSFLLHPSAVHTADSASSSGTLPFPWPKFLGWVSNAHKNTKSGHSSWVFSPCIVDFNLQFQLGWNAGLWCSLNGPCLPSPVTTSACVPFPERLTCSLELDTSQSLRCDFPPGFLEVSVTSRPFFLFLYIFPVLCSIYLESKDQLLMVSCLGLRGQAVLSWNGMVKVFCIILYPNPSYILLFDVF